MTKILAAFVILVVFVISLNARDNFSEMSTQELISIIGYVKKNDLAKFKAELKSRKKTMNKQEKKMYHKNLKKSAKNASRGMKN